MAKYILHRIVMMIPVLIGCVIIVFTINYFSTTQPASIILGQNATPEMIEQENHLLGLDRPYIVQLGSYFWNIITKGDFGTSYIYSGVKVSTLIVQRLPVTIEIGVLSTLFSVLIGVPLGILAAVKQNTPIDYGTTVFGVGLSAIPNFWLAQILMLIFGLKLHLLPISGLGSWKNLVLPIIATGIGPITMMMRMTRSSMLEVIRQDYIRTARSKGLTEKQVIWKHALKNAMIPVATIIGMSLGVAMTGSIIAETIFNIPGLGLLMNSSINGKDYITVQGCVLVCAFIVTAMNLVTDICYAFIDPRIKAQYTAGSKVKSPKKRGAEGGVS